MPSQFPFDIIVLWIRPDAVKNDSCMFCKQPSAYELHYFISLMDFLKQGSDRVWSDLIRKQMAGNYKAAYYQPVCLEHCIEFASVQLGKRGPVQQLLTAATHAKLQQRIELSQAIACTVNSLDDEGDLWIASAPNTSIQDVVEHLKTVERK